jgi:hypothetical protein
MSDTDIRCSRARHLGSLFLLVVSTATTAGCVSRAAPFDQLDQASVTIYKLQAPQAAQAQPAQPQVGQPLIPGLPPELAQLGQAALQQLQAQGLLPPGITIPGLPGAQPVVPVQPQLPMYRGQWAIADQRPVMDEALKEKLLDLFGDAESFNEQRGNCFFPGMAISFQSQQFPEPVDVVVSLSCNQAVGYGFQWPHPQSGFTTTTHQTLTNVYQSQFGPVPPGA